MCILFYIFKPRINSETNYIIVTFIKDNRGQYPKPTIIFIHGR